MSNYDKWVGIYYRRQRKKGIEAKQALNDAKTLAGFDALECEGLVKIELEPDNDCDMTFLDQEMYTATRGDRALREWILAKAESDGCWGIVGYYRLNDESAWSVADSVWGFVGQEDAQQSEYAVAIKAACIEQWQDASCKKIADL